MRPSPTFLRPLARFAAPRAVRASPPDVIPAPKRLYHPPQTSTFLRPQPALSLSRTRAFVSAPRYESTDSKTASQPASSTTAPESRLDRDQVPTYELTMTCKPCSTRSSHRISKQGYHHGTVMVTCPECKNRHLISDHLKIFSDKPWLIEDLMKEKGSLVKRGSISGDGDVEFWDDGSITPRSAHFIPNSTTKADSDAPEVRLTEPPTVQTAAPEVEESPREKGAS